MKAQDKTERVLRSLHILLSRSQTYPKEPSKVVIDKEQMVGLLNELTECIYDMMGEYEMTSESRSMAEREFQKHGDQIVLKANHKAEDVYAASVMYTDEALNDIQDIMEDTAETLQILFEEMQKKMKDEKQRLRSNQLELRSQLQDLADTDKYLKIIEDRNREKEKEKKAQDRRDYAASEKNIYADRSTGIKINKEYFEMMGIPLEDETQDEASVGEDPLASEIAELGLVLDNGDNIGEDPEIARRAAEAAIRVDTDAEYFRWKEQQEAEKSQSDEGAQEDPLSENEGEETGSAVENFSDEYFSDSEEEQVYEELYEPEPDYAAQEFEYENEPVYEDQGSAPEVEKDQMYEPETDYKSQEYEYESGQGYESEKISDHTGYEQTIHSEPEDIDGIGKAQQDLIEKATREAEEELSAGIHAIWESMSETIRHEEEENPEDNGDEGQE